MEKKLVGIEADQETTCINCVTENWEDDEIDRAVIEGGLIFLEEASGRICSVCGGKLDG